ncbi:MAG TPA: hypothetical protein P5531_08230 [Bacteroidales bacterium]|nr:hypothetical protein [Bacteroidales bacterium]HSA43514.1 hypothetical protein [Bacteroidales bacterium]
MSTETLILFFIGLSLAGFVAGLVWQNTGNAKKKSFKGSTGAKYLTAVSLIAMILLAVLYSILYNF